MMRSRVVLPQPEGPSRETNSPAATFEIDAAQDRGGAEGLFGAGNVER